MGKRAWRLGFASIAACLWLIACAGAPEAKPAEAALEAPPAAPTAPESSAEIPQVAESGEPTASLAQEEPEALPPVAPSAPLSLTTLSPGPVGPPLKGIPLYEPAGPAVAATPTPSAPSPAPSPAATPAATSAAKPAPTPAPKPAPTPPAPSAAAAKPAPTPAPNPAEPPDTAAASVPVIVAPSGFPAPPVEDPAAAPPLPSIEFGVRRGDRFELRVVGSGWTYLGEATGKEGIAYENRRFDAGDAVFSLLAEARGEYVLDFRRLDPLLGQPETKSARIVVAEASATGGAPASGRGVGLAATVTGSRALPPVAATGSNASVPGVPEGAARVSPDSAVPTVEPPSTPSAGVSPAPPASPAVTRSGEGRVAGTPASPSLPAVATPSPLPSSALGAVTTPGPVARSGVATAPSVAATPSAPSVATTPSVAATPSVATVPAAASASAPSLSPSTPLATSANAAPASDAPAELIRFARDELAASRFENARRSLERYLSLYPMASDEAWFLLGKVFEDSGPLRDIRKAHAAYKRVRDEWPESRFWQEAADKVAAIERRYFDIR